MAKEYSVRSGAAITAATPTTHVDTSTIWKVIIASALGTMIEWYDFYIFGSLAAVMSANFFPQASGINPLILTYATFGAGFAARPFGALVFGRVGDLVGRKYAFLVTLLIMGGSTTAIGLLPGYATLGVLAPIMLVLIRIVQGLALGGEYGGAAVYVAEHAPNNRRGYYTSFIQITATLGLFVSLAVVLTVRGSMAPAAFTAWGWRIPFLLSILLVVVSVFIRSKMKESPLFQHLKNTGQTSKSPLKDSLGNTTNWAVILTVLFGAAAGQAVVWYTGQFYVNAWMKDTLGVHAATADTMVAVALALGMPFFVLFGALSDRIGRKKVMMAGNLIAAIGIYPVFVAIRSFVGEIGKTTNAAGKTVPLAANPNTVAITLLIFVLVLFVTMVYGPIAAFLVESFPAKIRYTSVSLPYHVGNGYFGGFLPLIATELVLRTGNIFAGVAFPIAVAALTFVIGTFLLRETNHVSLHQETAEAYPTPVGQA